MISRAASLCWTRPIGFVIRFGSMSVNVKEKPDDFVIFHFFRPQFSSSTPPSHHNRKFEDPAIAMEQMGWQKSRPKKSKTNSQKCWTKTQYREFESPAIMVGKIGWQKSRPKNQTDVSDFFSSDFCHPISHITIAGSSNSQYCAVVQQFWVFTHRNRSILGFAILRLRQTVLRILNSKNCWWGKLGDDNHSQKNRKRRFDFFGHDFRHPTTHIPTYPIAIIRISQTQSWSGTLLLVQGASSGLNRSWFVLAAVVEVQHP